MSASTSFAPDDPKARAAAEATRQHHGYADLHSMASWEILYAIEEAIAAQGVLARPDTIALDREKIRAGLARDKVIDGLLGPICRTADRGRSSISCWSRRRRVDGARSPTRRDRATGEAGQAGLRVGALTL